MSTPKRAAIYGPEPWLTHSGAVWSRWDLWFCLVACVNHDEALQSVAYLHAAQGRLTRFAATAAVLGSDHWRPIVTMAQTALSRGRIDIARATFAAADRLRMQQRYPRERCIELTGSPPVPPS